MITKFTFRGEPMHAMRGERESPENAVARSISRRVGAAVSLHWQDRAGDRISTYRVVWYDPGTETYQEHAATF